MNGKQPAQFSGAAAKRRTQADAALARTAGRIFFHRDVYAANPSLGTVEAVFEK